MHQKIIIYSWVVFLGLILPYASGCSISPKNSVTAANTSTTTIAHTAPRYSQALGK